MLAGGGTLDVKNTVTATFPGIIREQGNATSNRTGSWFMKIGTKFLFLMLCRLGSHSELFKK